MGVLGEGLEPIVIEPTTSSSKSEACPVLVLSDFHLDETVTLAQTNGRNQFNAAIRTQRVERLFRAGLNLIQNHLNSGVDVMNTVVMPLLGDFINNQLHEEATETNNMLPAHAALEAENVLAGGINYFLKNSSYDLIIPCKVGNHGRTTKKNQFATENGHSWEYMIYMHLAKHFAVTEPKRVRFQINDGYHEYVTVHEKVLRLHHGHAINYGGGIGGIFIPAFKAISQWDKIIRADLDIFGHFHQSKDGGKFVSNGSLVGYNSYALSIKADYEPPSQTLLLIDKKRGRTCNWPVLLAS
jgi:hypothetical protein